MKETEVRLDALKENAERLLENIDDVLGEVLEIEELLDGIKKIVLRYGL